MIKRTIILERNYENEGFNEIVSDHAKAEWVSGLACI